VFLYFYEDPYIGIVFMSYMSKFSKS